MPRKTITLSDSALAELERRHSLMVTLGKSRTLGDTLNQLIETPESAADASEAVSGPQYLVVDRDSLSELSESLLRDLKYAVLPHIRDTVESQLEASLGRLVADQQSLVKDADNLLSDLKNSNTQ